MTTMNSSRVSYLRWHYAHKQVVEFLDGEAIAYYKVIGSDPTSATITISPAYGKPKKDTCIPYKRKMLSYFYDSITDKRKEL